MHSNSEIDIDDTEVTLNTGLVLPQTSVTSVTVALVDEGGELLRIRAQLSLVKAQIEEREGKYTSNVSYIKNAIGSLNHVIGQLVR